MPQHSLMYVSNWTFLTTQKQELTKLYCKVKKALNSLANRDNL